MTGSESRGTGPRCVGILGGTFDPVHNGHVALGELFARLLSLDELRVIPAGNPWQKSEVTTSSDDRLEMVRLAFADRNLPVFIDTQEIARNAPSYSVDTLRALRSELGRETSIALLIGADQLQQLHTWHRWRELFDHAHVCAASRPGFAMNAPSMNPDVAAEFGRRSATPSAIRSKPCGNSMLTLELAIDISATQIRAALANGTDPGPALPPAVLDYVKQHHLYQPQ